jgi:RNA polymerase sigma-70 factor (ECF subfamily)
VVRHAGRFDRSKRFSTWLFQIAINLCRDWHRRAPPAADPLPADAAAPPQLGRSEAAVDAAALLGELPQEQREVVILRYYHDLTEQQMAAILDCPKGTVKSRLHNALARMAARVRKDGA